MKYYSIFFLIFLFSCNKTNISNIYFYSFEDRKIENLKLIIKEEKENKFYSYKKNDTIKKINLIYNLNKELLVSGKDTFCFIEKTYKSMGHIYKMYQPKTINNKTLVFHKNYGLLAKATTTENHLFLKDSLSTIDYNIIFKQIMLALHKTDSN